jgi:hypothetical protein
MGTAVAGQTQSLTVTLVQARSRRRGAVHSGRQIHVTAPRIPAHQGDAGLAVSAWPGQSRLLRGPAIRVSCQASCNESGWSASAEYIRRIGSGLRLVQRIRYIGAIDAVPCSTGSGGQALMIHRSCVQSNARLEMSRLRKYRCAHELVPSLEGPHSHYNCDASCRRITSDCNLATKGRTACGLSGNLHHSHVRGSPSRTIPDQGLSQD